MVNKKVENQQKRYQTKENLLEPVKLESRQATCEISFRSKKDKENIKIPSLNYQLKKLADERDKRQLIRSKSPRNASVPQVLAHVKKPLNSYRPISSKLPAPTQFKSAKTTKTP